MTGHLVLLGDSVFDNAEYVPDGSSVTEHLQRVLPADWQVTLLAVDGSTISAVDGQLQKIPSDTTHIVLSVGGNDALGHAEFIKSATTDSFAAALMGMASIRDEFSTAYSQMLTQVRGKSLPLIACTIYDSVPGLLPLETVGLSIFNDVITRHVFAAGVPMLDLRLICTESTDYAEISPIEPSASGGEKIAEAIHRAIFDAESGCPVVV